MICSVCAKRFAPFPEEDFKLVEGEKFAPIKEGAEERRLEVFESDKVGVCGPICEEAIDLMVLSPLISDI